MLEGEYAFSIFSKIISVVIGLLYAVFYSRYMGPTYRGISSIIVNYADIIMLISCLGIYQAYPYYRKITPSGLYAKFINITTAWFLLLLLISIFIALFFRENYIIVSVLILFPFMMIVKQYNYIVMIEKPTIRNKSQIIIDISSLVIAILLYFFTKINIVYCIIFLFTKEFIAFGLSFYNLHVPLKSIKLTLQGFVPYAKYGFIPMITIILMEVNYKVDVIMLEQLNISAADIGIYSLGVLLAQKVWIIPDALKDVLTSKLSKGKDAIEVCRVTRLSFFLIFIFNLFLFAFGRPLICFFFGNDFEESYDVIVTISLGTMGMVFYKMIYAYFVVQGKRLLNFLLLFITAISNIIANYYLIPIYGIIGAAFASTISYCICGISFVISFNHTVHIPIKDIVFVKITDFQINKIK